MTGSPNHTKAGERSVALLALLLVAMTSVIPAAVATNEELLDNEQYRLLLSLEDMYWQENSSRNDIRKVMAALESKKYRLGEAALRAVVLHGLSETAPMLRKGVGKSSSINQVVSRMIADAFAGGVDPLAYLRAASLDELSKDERSYVSEIITSIIVIVEARALRAGLKSKTDIGGRALSSYQRRLLAYSAIDRTTAIADLLAEIVNTRFSWTTPRDPLDLLRTFGQDGVDAVLSRLSSATVREEISDRGIGNLLDLFLLREALSMNTETKQRTLRILSRIDTEGSPKLLQKQVNSVRERLLR